MRSSEKEITARMNTLRDHSRFYTYKSDDGQLRAYAEKLETIPDSVLTSALNSIAENAGKNFPTIGEIKSSISIFYKHNFQNDETKFKTELNAENKKFEDLKKQVIEIYTLEGFLKFRKYWLKKHIGDTIEMGELEESVFDKAVVFDMAGGGSPEQIIARGEQKFLAIKSKMPKKVDQDYWTELAKVKAC